MSRAPWADAGEQDRHRDVVPIEAALLVGVDGSGNDSQRRAAGLNISEHGTGVDVG